MQSSDRRRFPWIRFSISTLLFLIFCAAGALLGFRVGLSRGIDAQLDSRLAALRSQVYPISYRVGDLTITATLSDETRASGDSESDSKSGESPTNNIGFQASKLLTDEIRAAVARRRWDESGGPCTIGVLNASTIVISASSLDHELVSAFLAGRRGSSSRTSIAQERPSRSQKTSE